MRFHDRAAAGRALAERLQGYAGRDDVVVLALPRGGVPVGAELARRLDVPLDLFLVRKLGVPGHEELAMGAIASGGVRVINDDVIAGLGLTDEDVARTALVEGRELERREQLLAGSRPLLAVHDLVIGHRPSFPMQVILAVEPRARREAVGSGREQAGPITIAHPARRA